MIVLDASFLVKLFLEEKDSGEAYEIIEGFLVRGEKLFTIDIALSEVLNVLWKHHILIKDIDRKVLNEAVSDLLELWRKIDKISTIELVEDAMEISLRYHIAIYDSLYLAAAVKYKAGIATYDERQREIAGELKIVAYP